MTDYINKNYGFDSDVWKKYYDINLSEDGFKYEVARYEIARGRLDTLQMKQYEDMLQKMYGFDMAEAIKTNRWIINGKFVAGVEDIKFEGDDDIGKTKNSKK